MNKGLGVLRGEGGDLVYPPRSLTAHAQWILDGGFYPVAKNNREGSGSNKFCLAVLAWDKARLGAPGLGG